MYKLYQMYIRGYVNDVIIIITSLQEPFFRLDDHCSASIAPLEAQEGITSGSVKSLLAKENGQIFIYH